MMPAPIKRFLETPEGAETSHKHILFENFGMAVYYAQLFEGTLQNLLMCMKLTGLLKIDREKFNIGHGADGIISSCIGPMIRLLQDGSRVELPPDFFTLLRTANKMRNDLIHRFLAERADQTISEVGHIAVTDELLSYYTTIRKAHAVLVPLCDKLLEILGVSREELERRQAELLSYGKPSLDITEET